MDSSRKRNVITSANISTRDQIRGCDPSSAKMGGGASAFSSSSTAEDVTLGIDGSGIIAIVTGASSGIAKETSRILALRGMHVIMAVRNMAAGRDAKEEIVQKIPSAKVDTMDLDLASMSSEDRVDITANSLHPGGIVTNLFRNSDIMSGLIHSVGKLVFKNVEQGAATTCYVSLHSQVKGMIGEYFVDSNLSKASTKATHAELAKKLWDFSVNLTE